MYGAKFFARLLGEEEAGHLGRHIQHLAACGVAPGQVQEHCVFKLNLSAAGLTSLLVGAA